MRAELVKEAMERAYKNRDAGEYVIVHSDRGAQYASGLVRGYLDSKMVIRGMIRKGNCCDNSMMEPFFSRFKTEHMFWENTPHTKKSAARFLNGSRSITTENGLRPLSDFLTHRNLRRANWQ